MKDRKKKILIGLVLVLGIMAVGYSVLSATLKITGTAGIENSWNVYISKIEEKELNAASTISTEIPEPTTANFSVDLEKPGSYAEYEVTVKNDGNIDAILTKINGIDEANEKEPKDIVYSIKGLEPNTPLLIGKEVTFIVRVDFKASATSLPSTNKDLELSLDYEQSTGLNNPEIAVNKPSYSVDQTGWQQSKTVTITYPERRPELIYEYSLDGGNSWTKLEAPAITIEIPFTENGSVIARVRDGINTVTASAFAVTEVATPASCFTVSSGAITGYSCTDKDVIIPQTINGTKITSIGSSAFSNKGLTSVVIPDSVTSIGNYAFDGNKLTSVDIPKTVISIGTAAFRTNQLTNVNLTYFHELTTIGTSAFEGNKLKRVKIPSKVTSIGSRAFYNNPDLVEINNLPYKAFNWNSIINGAGGTSAVTGTYGKVEVTSHMEL